MKKNILWIGILLTLSLLALPQQPVKAQSADATVQGWFFWMDGCPHCADVLQNVMPAIAQRYADQLEITYVEVVNLDDVDALYRIAAEYGLSKEETGVPLVIINHQALAGADIIADNLDAAIQDAISAGGARYDALPVIPGRVSMRAPEIHNTGETKAKGFGIAKFVLAGMILVVLYEFYRFAVGAAETASQPEWQRLAILILALLGLGVAFYLGFVESTHATAVCGPVGDCNSVQHSPYARLFGLIPIAWMGVAGYVLIILAWAAAAWRKDTPLAHWAHLTIYGAAFFGTLFSIYLTYLEPFVIHAVCMWCISSAIIMTLILLLSTTPALQALDEDLF